MVELEYSYQKVIETSSMPNGKKKTLLAAINLFSKQGFQGTSTAQLAEAAGVSQATIYKYFATKDELLKDILQVVFPVISKEFFSELIKYTNLEEAISFIVRNRFDFLSDNKEIIKIFLQEIMLNEELREIFKKNVEKVFPVLNQFLEKLAIHNPKFDSQISPLEFIRLTLGNIITYFVQVHVFGLNFQDKEFERLMNQILCSLQMD